MDPTLNPNFTFENNFVGRYSISDNLSTRGGNSEAYTKKLKEDTDNICMKLSVNKIVPKISRLLEPWAKIGTLNFHHLESVILANVDMVTNFSNHHGGNYALSTHTSDTRLSFLCINDAPGGYTDYLTWRRPDSFGFVMSAKTGEDGPNGTYREEFLESRQFSIFPGANHTGDIRSNVEGCTAYTREAYHEGLSFIVGRLSQKDYHSSLWSDTIPTYKDMSDDEYETAIALLALCFENIASNGKICMELPESMSWKAMDIIFSLANMFETIYLIKPISTPVHDRTVYIVGRDLKVSEGENEKLKESTGNVSGSSFAIPDNRNYGVLESFRKKIWNLYLDRPKNKKRLFSSFPTDFMEWIEKINDNILSNQKKILLDFEEISTMYRSFDEGDILDGKYEEIQKKYDFDRLKAVIAWNLKDNKKNYTLNCNVLS